MLMKGIMAIIDQWPIPINFRGGATWFNLSLSLYKVKGQYSIQAAERWKNIINIAKQRKTFEI